MNHESVPAIIDSESGQALTTQWMGHAHPVDSFSADRNYWMLFLNPGELVKRGDRRRGAPRTRTADRRTGSVEGVTGMPALGGKAIAAILLAGLLAVAGVVSLSGTAQPATAAPNDMVSVIVTLKDQATLAGLGGTTRQRSARAGDQGASAQGRSRPGEAEERARGRPAARERPVTYRRFWVLNGLEVTATRAFRRPARAPPRCTKDHAQREHRSTRLRAGGEHPRDERRARRRSRALVARLHGRRHRRREHGHGRGRDPSGPRPRSGAAARTAGSIPTASTRARRST